MRTRIVAAFAALALAGLTGCGDPDASDSVEDAAPAPEPTTETPTPEESTEPPEPSYEMSHSVVWAYENPQAYTFDMEIRFGDPIDHEEAEAAVHPEDEDLVVGQTCDFDPQTDAVIFGQLVATATTEGFDTDISAAYTVNALGDQVSGGDHGDGRIEIAQGFSGGPECEYLASENFGVEDARVHWSEPVPTGEQRTHDFFVVLREYFSPTAPDGDVAWLESHGFTPNFGGSNTSDEERQQIYQPNTSEVRGITFTGEHVR